MTPRLLLWDIDGTLLRAGPIGATVFDQAVADVTGSPPPGRVPMGGKTDPLIVAEHLALLGVEATATVVEEVLDRLVARMAASAGEIAAEGAPCPGVPELLEVLANDPRFVSGVLTGNLVDNARVKLAAFGLDRWVDLEAGAFGSDDLDRDRLVPIALARARARYGEDLEAEQAWVIGDTPRDLGCARVGGARCLLVGTGSFAAADLGLLGADATLVDLSDTAAVVALLANDPSGRSAQPRSGPARSQTAETRPWGVANVGRR